MCDSDIYINGVTWRNKNETESYPKTNKFANVIYERTNAENLVKKIWNFRF